MSNEAGKDELEEINLGVCCDSSLLFSQVLNLELEGVGGKTIKVCKVPISSGHYLAWRRISCQLRRQTWVQIMLCGGQ